ncbi:unnamed protein product [Timema podura]|uniref:Uncharacterized protein n=1 Tax=Timema podura TaxID=61482 RepID=A0ABN7NV11_TIMPD|nr:unnamed protein product [Timema podura]
MFLFAYSAYNLIKMKGYTSWAVALSVSAIAGAILKNTMEVMPVTTYIKELFTWCARVKRLYVRNCLLGVNEPKRLYAGNCLLGEHEQRDCKPETAYLVCTSQRDCRPETAYLLANASVVLSSTVEDGEIEVRISVGGFGTGSKLSLVRVNEELLELKSWQLRFIKLRLKGWRLRCTDNMTRSIIVNRRRPLGRCGSIGG